MSIITYVLPLIVLSVLINTETPIIYILKKKPNIKKIGDWLLAGITWAAGAEIFNTTKQLIKDNLPSFAQ